MMSKNGGIAPRSEDFNLVPRLLAFLSLKNHFHSLSLMIYDIGSCGPFASDQREY